MPSEGSCYVGPQGIEFAHNVVDELGHSTVAPTPPNYEVWAGYRSGAFPDLNREIDERFRTGGKLSAEMCEEFFERFFAPTQTFDQLLQTGESIAHELASALAHLRDASSCAGGYAGSLETVASAMEVATEPHAIQLLVRHLVQETRAVAARNKDLENRMEASSQKMETLQASVRQATLDAISDGLTGLANRKHFDRVLSRSLREAAERGEPMCLLMCDIDHFKRINDQWGHPVGDQVIKYVASALRLIAPQEALAARYGGEEYALILPRADREHALTLGQALCERVRERTLARKSSGDVLGVVTISVGIAALNAGENRDSLVRRADAALYQAKRNGRNCVVSDLEVVATAA